MRRAAAPTTGSASGDASEPADRRRRRRTVDIEHVPRVRQRDAVAANPPHNTVDGVHYGVPYMWGPNFLLYNTDVVKPAPDSWASVFDANSPYAGKITGLQQPDLHRRRGAVPEGDQPDLGITDPYELTADQLDAAVSLLKTQYGLIGKYWALYTDEINGFDSRRHGASAPPGR